MVLKTVCHRSITDHEIWSSVDLVHWSFFAGTDMTDQLRDDM